MHDRFQPSRQGRVKFRPDHVFIALAFHRAHAQPPDARRGGKQQQAEHHAEHDARHARMTGQRIGFGETCVHVTRGKHLFDRIDLGGLRNRRDRRGCGDRRGVGNVQSLPGLRGLLIRRGLCGNRRELRRGLLGIRLRQWRLRRRNGRDRLLQHIRGLMRVSDDWLEFVGHSHREYGIVSTVYGNGRKI